MQSLGTVSLLVENYDLARDFFVEKLGFEIVEDSAISPSKRWLLLRPKDAPAGSTNLLLAQPSNEGQRQQVGRQGHDRVMFFLTTDNFERDYRAMRAAGVQFLEQPRHETYGTVAVFKDLYGNRWDLIEHHIQ